MKRARILWSGSAVVGDGVTNVYLEDTVTDISALITFLGAVSNRFPAELLWTVPNVGDVINPANGELTSGTTFTGGGTQPGTGTDSIYAKGVGTRVLLGTNDVVSGRRVKGSWFMVPLESYCYNNDGDIATATRTQFNTALTTYLGGAQQLVWHRPSPGGSDGSAHDVSSMTISSKVSTLRSRRT